MEHGKQPVFNQEKGDAIADHLIVVFNQDFHFQSLTYVCWQKNLARSG